MTTPIIPVAGGAAPMDAILGLGMEEQAHARSEHSHHHHHHHEHGHDEFSSRIIALDEIDDVEAFEHTIAALALEFGILRAKGRVAVNGKALPYVVQAVGRRVDGYFARDRDVVSGRLVVIGMAGLDAAGIAARLDGRLIDEDASSQS